MNWTIPGTVLTAPRKDASGVEAQLRAMFLGGDIMLSQVTGITGLDAYMIQNWVKRGFLTKPLNKRYTLRQLCRILNINILRQVMYLDQICSMLSFVNGELDDESDDLIDDSDLYFIFVQIAARAADFLVDSPESRDALIRESMAEYAEPMPGAAERVEKVLRVMLTGYAASLLQQQAMSMLQQLEEET